MKRKKKKKPESQEYSCIKMKLEYFISDIDNINIIKNAVFRTNNIVSKADMLLKLFIINKYNSNNHSNGLIPFENIDKTFLNLIYKNILIPTTGRRNKNQDLLNVLNLLKNEYLPNLKLEDGHNLSSVLDYEIKRVITNLETNIKNHYLYTYLNTFINRYFNVKNSKNPNIKKELEELKNAIRNDNFKCHTRYHKWLKKYRYFIVPQDYNKSYFYDIEINPQKYLVHMVWLNELLEKSGYKTFQFIPQRKSFIPCHITIDTKGMSELLFQTYIDNGFKITKTEAIHNPSLHQEFIWDTLTNLNNYIVIKHRSNKIEYKKYKKTFNQLNKTKCSFDYTIITDGYSCSIRYVYHDKKNKNDIKKEKLRKGRNKAKEFRHNNVNIDDVDNNVDIDDGNIDDVDNNNGNVNIDDDNVDNNEFKYISEVDISLLTNKNVVVIDPGKDNLYTMKKIGEDTIYKYSSKKHIRYSKRIKITNKIKKRQESDKLIEINTESSNYSTKTTNLELYKDYCHNKLSIFNKEDIINKYNDCYYRKMRYNLYINKKRRIDKFLNEVEKQYKNDENEKETILVLGNASVNPTMKNYISTPNISLSRKLKTCFKMYLIDEFRTSMINCKTEKINKNLYIKNKKIHSVLTYKMENNRLGCINRDCNAVYNMEKLFLHYLKYKNKEEENERPEIFNRKTII